MTYKYQPLPISWSAPQNAGGDQEKIRRRPGEGTEENRLLFEGSTAKVADFVHNAITAEFALIDMNREGLEKLLRVFINLRFPLESGFILAVN